MAAPFDIHPSMLPAWNDCARRSAAQSMPGLIVGAGFSLRELENNVGACVGSGVHAGAAYTLTRKMEHGDMGFATTAVDEAVHEFERRAEDEGCVYDKTTPNKDTAQKQITRMTRSYRAHVAPQIDPALVEERKYVHIDEARGIRIAAKLDVLGLEPGRLRDLKTGTVRRSNLAQYGAYSMTYRAHGHDIDEIMEDYIPRVDLKRDQPKPATYVMDQGICEWEAEAAIRDVIAAIERFDDAVQHGTMPPETAFRANPNSMLCSPKFCAAWGTTFCQAHKRDD